MPAAYEAADLIVLPSLSEGLGFTLIEALASGTPTVATDIAGFREVLGDSSIAYIAEASDPISLRGRMLDAVGADPSEVTKRSADGRELVASRFSLHAMGDATDDALRALLGGREDVVPGGRTS